MSRIVKTLFTVALLASVASVAFAADKYPPGPPYRTCPDSVTIFQVQQQRHDRQPVLPGLATRSWDVGGIVTGFRLRSTGRLYIENSNGADYNGVQIYTSPSTTRTTATPSATAFRVRGLVRAVPGRDPAPGHHRHQARTEDQRGNPLPPLPRRSRASDTTTTLGSDTGCADGPTPRNGSLVRVNGPLRVARNTAGAGLYAGTNWLLVNADGSFPATASSSTATRSRLGQHRRPRRSAPSSTGCRASCGRTTARPAWTPHDLPARLGRPVRPQAPPNLSQAYPVAENKIRVVFDKNVDLDDRARTRRTTRWARRSPAPPWTTPTLVGGAGAVVDLTVTDVQPRLTLETIQTENIGSATCPTCLSPQQSRTFILGVLSSPSSRPPGGLARSPSPASTSRASRAAASAQGTRSRCAASSPASSPAALRSWRTRPAGCATARRPTTSPSRPRSGTRSCSPARRRSTTA